MSTEDAHLIYDDDAYDAGYEAGVRDTQDEYASTIQIDDLIGDADRVAACIVNEWPGMYRRDEFADAVIDRLLFLLDRKPSAQKGTP